MSVLVVATDTIEHRKMPTKADRSKKEQKKAPRIFRSNKWKSMSNRNAKRGTLSRGMWLSEMKMNFSWSEAIWGSSEPAICSRIA